MYHQKSTPPVVENAVTEKGSMAGIPNGHRSAKNRQAKVSSTAVPYAIRI